jgi:hypothetical protein
MWVVDITFHQVAPISELILPPLKVYNFYPLTGAIVSRTLMPAAAGAPGAPGATVAAVAAVAPAAAGLGSSTGKVPPAVEAAQGTIKKGGSKRSADAVDAVDEEGDSEDDVGDEEAEGDDELVNLAALEKTTAKKGRAKAANPKKKAKKATAAAKAS